MFFFIAAVLLTAQSFSLTEPADEVARWETFLLVERAEQTAFALEGARRYVPILKPLFRAEGVPEDLVWLALIESSFRPDATSPSKARGMFQFKRDTARAFGLRVDRHVDERTVPHLAGRAAARYLKYLRGKFDDWDLVLAAYNLGEGDLRRAMARHGKTTWPEIAPLLREETRRYVPKIKAAARIGNRHLAEAGIATDGEAVTATVAREAAAPAPRSHVVVKGDTLWRISRTYGVDLATLRRLNGLHRNHIEIGRVLLLPSAEN